MSLQLRLNLTQSQNGLCFAGYSSSIKFCCIIWCSVYFLGSILFAINANKRPFERMYEMRKIFIHLRSRCWCFHCDFQWVKQPKIVFQQLNLWYCMIHKVVAVDNSMLLRRKDHEIHKKWWCLLLYVCCDVPSSKGTAIVENLVLFLWCYPTHF